LWKITPLFSSWISSVSSNPFWARQILKREAAVIELGCGISGLVALTLAPLVRKYVATDQEYVRRFFRQNIEENRPTTSSKKGSSKKARASAAGSTKRGKDSSSNIEFIPLDWELDIPRNETLHADDTPDEAGFDLVISCDCIYNEALIPSFVRTCADICFLRSVANNTDNSNEEEKKNATMAIIAQQQRSPDVFEAWLKETLKFFRVWRVEKFDVSPATASSNKAGGTSGLGDGSGYVVHVLVLRDDLPASSSSS
jgi:predicted nicotinamide N-methyase